MFIIIELLFLGGLFAYLCKRTHDFLSYVEKRTVRGHSRRKFGKNKPFRPNYQFRYHWFKTRMRRKKKKRYRKPKRLLYLTWRYKTRTKLLVLTFRLLLPLLLVGCRVEHFLSNALVVVSFLTEISRPDIVAWLRKLLSYRKIDAWLLRLLSCGNANPNFIFAMHTDLPSNGPIRTRFDTDSIKCYLDTACSRTMSDRKDHFIDLKPWPGPETSVIGVGHGQLKVELMGTFVFNVEDESGIIRHVQIPGSAYVPGLGRTLISPQQWAKEDGDVKATQTYMINGAEGCWMVWNHGRTRRWVPHDPISNAPAFFTAPGSLNYTAFEAAFMAYDASHLVQRVRYDQLLRGDLIRDPAEFVCEEQINLPEMHKPEGVSELEGEAFNNIAECTAEQQCPHHPTGHHKWGECSLNPNNQSNLRKMGTLTFNPEPSASDEELFNDAAIASEDQAELLRWHHRLGHMPFSFIKQLAINGEIPVRLQHTQPPRCAGCLFGKMTKVPWRTRGKSNRKIKEVTRPGECVSVDQMQSTQIGFVAQMKGKLTRQRYTAATIFVDHFSRL